MLNETKQKKKQKEIQKTFLCCPFRKDMRYIRIIFKTYGFFLKQDIQEKHVQLVFQKILNS